MTVLDWRGLLAGVESLFSPPNGDSSSRGIGAELELIPFDWETRRVVPVSSRDGKQSLTTIQTVARHARWTEVSEDHDPPSWSIPGGGRVSYEPGGQIEVSSAPLATASELIRDLQCAAQLLESSFDRNGISLEAVGLDPYNDISEVPLQLHRSRYELMARYFDSIGSSGAKMMRQTASLQINVEIGPRRYERWALLNGLAPYVTAIFANSALYSGELTGNRSQRASLWRTLDSSRTGLPVDMGDPAEAYLRFALGAGAMMYGGAPYPSFEEWMRTGEPTADDWSIHLTTLFPEVRPRGYFELRSCDSISPQYLAAPVSFVAGLVYDDVTSRTAAEIVGSSDAAGLEVAGRSGLGDTNIRDRSIELVDLALAGCETLGPAYLSPADLESAAEFFGRYTRQGRSPGDDWS